MSTPFNGWMDWVIWGAILLVFIVTLFVIVGRIRRGVRNPDEPPDLNRPPLL